MDRTELKSRLYIYKSSALLEDLRPVILKGRGKGWGGWVTWPLEVFPPLFLKVNKQDTNSKVSGYGIPHPSMIDYCMVGFA